MGLFDNRLLNSLCFDTGITGRRIKKRGTNATLSEKLIQD